MALPDPAEVLHVVKHLRITTLGPGAVVVDGRAFQRSPEDVGVWTLRQEPPDESGEPSSLWRHTESGEVESFGVHLHAIATHYLTPSRPRQEVQSDG